MFYNCSLFSVPSVGAGAPEPDRGLQEPGSHQLSGHGESPSHHLMAKILRYWLHKSSLHGTFMAGNCTLIRRNAVKHIFFVYFFCGLECGGHSFAFVTHFVLLRDVWIGTQRASVASRRATNLATNLPNLANNIPT
jgi:hypothetical protein